MKHMRMLALSVGVAASAAVAATPWTAKDLNAVKIKAAPEHAPVVLVEKGQPKAVIVVMPGAFGDKELQQYIKESTGAELPVVRLAKIRPVTSEVAIVLGSCPEADAVGLVGSNMPPEGFAIKTAPNRVFIVGRDVSRVNNGTLWGTTEFAERYIGMRWFFPQAATNAPDIGRDIPKTDTLTVPPVWLEDAPFFRMRTIYPPWSIPSRGTGIDLGRIQTFLRAGTSWPIQLSVHQPNWAKYPELTNGCPECFQMRKDGSRQFDVLCYGNPKTLETYLKGIQAFLDKTKPVYAPVSATKAITVSPADVELACYCPDCRKLWDENGGEYGAASKVMATFVDKLAREVQTRWPDEGFTVIFLPYLNYTKAPDGFQLPGNVEVQICGMPGMACYKEPAIRDAEQANIDAWIKTSGRKIQNWHYNVWPAHKTKAAYQYPHVIKDFYQRNRDKTIGTFINGDFNHWPRQHISLYCWQKVLWNPDFDVDAAVDSFCARMFGPASKTMRELVGLQMDGWEKSRWPAGRFSPRGIYEQSFPTTTVARIRALMAQARSEAAGNDLVLTRLDYYEKPTLPDFYTESEMMAGKGFRPLEAQKVGENPVLDGKLDESAWSRTPSNMFVVAGGKTAGQPPVYPTSLQALWTPDGITFGFRMAEPMPDRLETANGGHDNGDMWWDDNVEIMIDVTGENLGEYYQFIVNPEGNYWDSRRKDATFECKGFKTKSFRGPDFWSMEVFIPYAAFPEAKVPGSGTHTAWSGNFTRHRVVDCGRKPGQPKAEGSVREYQRMNTLGASASDNLADFSAIKFIE